MKKYIKSNIKSFFIGGFLSICVVVSASTFFDSNQVEYKNGESVKHNIDQLYEKTKTIKLQKADLTEVEYLETQGNQYIDTNVIFDQNSRINVKFKTPNTIDANGTSALFFAGEKSTNYGFAINSSQNSGKYRYFYGNTYNGDTMLSGNTIYTIDINKEQIFLNESLIKTMTTRDFTIKYTMPLFGQYYNSNNIINKSASGTRLYYCRIWNNDILIRYFIPCYKNSDKKAGLYDLVNNEFYPNLGEDDFLYPE